MYPLAVLALAAAYYGAAELGYALEVAGPVAAIVWLPVGVGIAALYLGGTRLWPGVLIGDLLANDYGALPVGTALVQTCGNLAEVIDRGDAAAPRGAPRAAAGQHRRPDGHARRARRRRRRSARRSARSRSSPAA